MGGRGGGPAGKDGCENKMRLCNPSLSLTPRQLTAGNHRKGGLLLREPVDLDVACGSKDRNDIQGLSLKC